MKTPHKASADKSEVSNLQHAPGPYNIKANIYDTLQNSVVRNLCNALSLYVKQNTTYHTAM